MSTGPRGVMDGVVVSAHGVGGAADLPIPADFAIAGGVAALVLSFTVLLVAWRRPRYDAVASGHPLPRWFTTFVASWAFAWPLRAAGLVFTAYVVWAAAFGADLMTNPAFGVVYVWLWVGIVPVSLLFGRFFRAVSPLRTIHGLLCRLGRTDPAEGVVRLSPRVGYWPAAAGLFAFVWLELVSPPTYLAPLTLWFAAYLVTVLLGAVIFGERWFERADPFEVYSTLLAHLSVWGRRGDGILVVRAPLHNLAGLRPAPGLVAVVAVLLGSTAFDSFVNSNYWLRFSQTATVNMTAVETALLIGACAVVGISFTAATMATPTAPGHDRASAREPERVPATPHASGTLEKSPLTGPSPSPRSVRVLEPTPPVRSRRTLLPGMFAHSLVPIIVGYMVAHYLTLLVETGQQTLIQLSDPMVTGANLLGTADLSVNYWLSTHPTFLASTKVLAIVTGHVVGAIAAHDYALKVLPARHHATGQLPLLMVMVTYTSAGLYLLFSA